VATGLRLVVGWHAIGAVAALVALLAAVSPAGELPGVVRTVLIVFWAGALVSSVAAGIGLRGRQVKQWARTTSLVTSYLVFVVCAVVYAHRIGVFRGFNSLADGFERGILAVPFIALGLWWVSAARSVGRRKGFSPSVRGLRIAGWAVAAAATAAFLLFVDLPGGLVTMAKRTAEPWSVGALVIGVLAWLAFRFVWSPRVGDHFGTTRDRQEALTGLLFLSPNILGFAAFFAGPLLFSLVISFFDWDAFGGTRSFIGIDNYVKILSLQFTSVGDGPVVAGEVLKPGYQQLMRIDWFGLDLLVGARDILFWTSLRNIVIFLVLAVPLSVFPALVLSTILNSKLRGMKFFRAVYFVPSVAGVIGITIIWGQLFSSTVGWINYLRTRAAEVFSFLPLIDEPTSPYQTPWLSSSSTALVAIVIVFAWMTFGFNTILYLAGHQGINNDLYEAAELDGANAWQRFKRITVPQLRSTTFYVVATTSILAMQQFDIVFVLTNPPGGPSNSTLTPVLHLYNEGFQSSRHGYASAVAWVLFLMIFGLTIAQFRRQRETV
jgi:ABC-type sugar transport system permease subunit